MTVSNLPSQTDSTDEKIKDFFDRYYVKKISYAANEVDAVVGFFLKRGFEQVSANIIASVLLQQAKVDEVNVFKLIDTLSGLNEVQISSLIAEILNNNRNKTSTIGYKKQNELQLFETRNILV